MTPARYRIYVLLVWHPQFGAAVAPVGVLGVDERAEAGPSSYVVWVPLSYDATQPWRDRLAIAPTPSRIQVWLDTTGTIQLEEITDPPSRDRLADVADAVLDELLTEVLPLLNSPGRP